MLARGFSLAITASRSDLRTACSRRHALRILGPNWKHQYVRSSFQSASPPTCDPVAGPTQPLIGTLAAEESPALSIRVTELS